jgi:hypothetical protein
MSLMVLVW